jgi:hypothetical protein
MSNWSTGDAQLLHDDARVQAQVAPLDVKMNELGSFRGGMYPLAGENADMPALHAFGGKRSLRKHTQRGGMSAFTSPGRLLDAKAYNATGVNPQFFTEKNVNKHFTGF